MKKVEGRWIVLYGFFLLTILIFILVYIVLFANRGHGNLGPDNNPIINDETSTSKLVRQCNDYLKDYPSSGFDEVPPTMALAHGIKFPCYDLYTKISKSHDKEVCLDIKQLQARATCMGIASQDINDLEACSKFTGELKDGCLLDIVIKAFANGFSDSKQEALDICAQINAPISKSACLSYIVNEFKDPSLCNFEGEMQLLCLNQYLSQNQNTQDAVDFCDSYFTDQLGRIRCYSLSIINLESDSEINQYGGCEIGKFNMIFINYSKVINKKLILLDLRNTSSCWNDIVDSSYYENYYICNSVFEDPSLIPSECTQLEWDIQDCTPRASGPCVM